MPPYRLGADAGFNIRRAGAETGEAGPVRRVARPRGGGLSHVGAIYETWWEFLAPYLAEFFGSFCLTMTFVCNTAMGDPVWAVTSSAFVLTALMYAFAGVSAGSFNPSVNVALLLSSRTTPKVFGLSCLSQILGASAAGMLQGAFMTKELELGPKDGFGWWEAMIVEIVYTAMTCFVYLSCAASRRNNPSNDPNGFIGLAMGLCSVAGGYAAQPISGAVLNPAIAIGLQLAEIGDKFMSGWGIMYLPYEIFGAFLGVAFFRVVRRRETDATDWLEEDLDLADRAADSIFAQLSAEFIGTFFIVFTKGLTHLQKSRAEAWATAAAVGAVIYSIGGVSGGHLNPAVTLSVAASGKTAHTFKTAAFYAGVQVLSGLAASSLFTIVHHVSTFPLWPDNDRPWATVAAGEVVFTALICYVTLATLVVNPTVSKTKQKNCSPFAVCCSYTAGGCAVGQVSGGYFNPAVCLGVSVTHILEGGRFYQSFFFLSYEILGAAIATMSFFITHFHEYRTDVKVNGVGYLPSETSSEVDKC
eukprot:gnl/TRDRNA2_/TRDRNA2_182590_c0_seq1.p1 gnl/TRDRNA2_/TRDRNA2_182590_c0~~gnl/TRDRNA2_/TRDRNA2_182590_c0_seq1.p1  ORF type:complete len:529 (-),score=76.05 gnl/TRDRNA2_/TRDRNA2_182590_c0_seq1:55-1641(-)